MDESKRWTPKPWHPIAGGTSLAVHHEGTKDTKVTKGTWERRAPGSRATNKLLLFLLLLCLVAFVSFVPSW